MYFTLNTDMYNAWMMKLRGNRKKENINIL